MNGFPIAYALRPLPDAGAALAADGRAIRNALSYVDRGVHAAVAQAVREKAEEQGLRRTLVAGDTRNRAKTEGPLRYR
jgi:hypothetical protein